MWKEIIKIITTPVRWFWKTYGKYVDEKKWGKAILVAVLSLLGLAFSLFAVGYLIYILIAGIVYILGTYPIILLIIAGVVWLYQYVKDSTEKKDDVVKQDEKVLRDQALQGYPSMLNVVYQVLRAEVENVGGIMPTFPAEIEMPEAHFVIKEHVILYQFKLDKKNVETFCDEAMLKEYRNNFQYRIRRKLQNGEFPSIKIVDFRDQFGNGMDGIIVDHIDDFGRYFVIYTAYASTAYAEYHRVIMQNMMSRTERSSVFSEEWKS